MRFGEIVFRNFSCILIYAISTNYRTAPLFNRTLLRITLFSILLFFGYSLLNSAIPYSKVNTKFDDRAIAFRGNNYTDIETWKTVGGKGGNPFSMALERSNSGAIQSFQTIDGIARDQLIIEDVILDGSAAFPYCGIYDGGLNWGVFVSNRLYGGKDYDNDIYQISLNGTNISCERINEVSSEYWDDTPALSSDGNTMFFSSNRNNPLSGKTDMFLSVKQSGKWSSPAKVSIINTDKYNELSPFIGYDGYLYFSSDRGGDYDIWRVSIDNSCRPAGTVEKLSEEQFPYVNKAGSNEFSPCFSIGGNFFIFSSNRKPADTNDRTRDYDMYYIDYSNQNGLSKEIEIKLEVRQIERDYESPDALSKGLLIAKELECESDLEIMYNSDPSNVDRAATGSVGDYFIKTKRKLADLPELDFRYRELVINIDAKCCGTSTKHTLKYDTFCDSMLGHKVIFACKEEAIDTIPFVIDTIPFFVTGYWCPSTDKYRDWTLCSSLFQIMENCPPSRKEVSFEPLCDRNEVFSYGIKPPIVKPKTIRKRHPGAACIDTREMRKLLDGELMVNDVSYIDAVDNVIYSLIEQMKMTMENPYVNLTREENRKIRIEVYGWTDWRAIDKSCEYTGETIDLNNSFVKIDTQAIHWGKPVTKKYIKNGIIESGTRFVGQWRSGNQLLSDLRAYYIAVLLDELWTKKVPKYKSYRHNIEIVAIGRSISNTRGVSLAANRSVDVMIRLDQREKLSEFTVELNPDVEKWLWKPDCIHD